MYWIPALRGRLMSKLTVILNSFQREQEEKTRCTVAQLAEELNKGVNLLLEQFANAGVVFSGPDDLVLEEHKKRLLDWLKGNHLSNSEKRISIRKGMENSQIRSDWRAVAAGENGAEWECLSNFAAEVIIGNKIHPERQRIVNLIVAKAVIQGVLPPRRTGRPKEPRTDQLAMEVSDAYWLLMDSGYSSEMAVEILSSRFHKTERQIYRYVQSQKPFSRSTKSEREQLRAYWRISASLNGEVNPDGWPYEFRSPDLSSLTDEDYLDHLRELIAKEAKEIADINHQPFLDSDIDE
jgi:hypothetical protein